ncbi:hypothetical protein CC80DRAFT_506863 [Byssothecium circinans]|uniref:Uncharacterized protein n=1 Tax=Byssothecium circinans TaxID=147558 RepID=A0A6A5TQV4_9PLEO|nr:hypothetical protein CC80DRAFT_506863 [Byssothecium circinans]
MSEQPIILDSDICTAILDSEKYQPESWDRFGPPGGYAPPDPDIFPVLTWVNESRSVAGMYGLPAQPYSESTRGDHLVASWTCEPGGAPAMPRPCSLRPLPPCKPIEHIIADLLKICHEPNDRGMCVVDMEYVVKCMPWPANDKHLEFYAPIGRVRLRNGSSLLEHGQALGMPLMFMRWLGGAIQDWRLVIPANTLRTGEAAFLKALEDRQKAAEQAAAAAVALGPSNSA